MSRIVYCVALLLAVLGTVASRVAAQVPAPATVALNSAPFLPQPGVAASADFKLERGFGLFVGINEFQDKSLSPLHYAVNDAIGLAYHFVKNGQVDPTNCTLLLSGEAVGAEAISQLKELTEQGIVPQPATYTTILGKVRLLTSTKETNVLIMSFGSHGFFEDGTNYIMPADGSRGDLKQLSINVTTLTEKLRQSATKKSILIVDACRVHTYAGTKGGGERRPDAFRAAFDVAAGHAALFSCDSEQVSYESEVFQKGVFTHYLLEGLSGKADVDERSGFITLGTLIAYTDFRVQAWIEKERPAVGPELQQKPELRAAQTIRAMPVARNKDSDKLIADLLARRDAATDLLRKAYADSTFQARIGFQPNSEISSALAVLPVEPKFFATSPLGQLIGMLEDQLRPPTLGRIDALITWWKDQKDALTGGRLTLVIDPPNAVVTIDGTKSNLTSPVDTKLSAGERQLTLTAAGRETTKISVSIEPGKTVDLGKVALPVSVTPRLLHLEPVTLKVKQPFSRTLEVENGPASLKVTDLPPGLTFNTASQKIEGVSQLTGGFLAKVTATGKDGAEVKDVIEFRIVEPDKPRLSIPRVKDGQAKAYTGESFTFGIDADNEPTKYEATGLPSGLKVDSATGAISGRPTRTGTFTITLYASNDAGRGSAELELEVARRRVVINDTDPSPVVAYTYTFFINGQTYRCRPDNQIVDTSGGVVGQLGPAVVAGSIGQLYFGAVFGYLHAYPDGNLVAVFPNGTWQIRGTWRPGG